MFRSVGFHQVRTRGKEIDFLGQTSEVDAIYVLENLVVVCEDTFLSEGNIKPHFLKKAAFSKHIAGNQRAFLAFARETYRDSGGQALGNIDSSDFHIRFVYASNAVIDSRHAELQPHMHMLSGLALRYFTTLTKAIHRSARNEVLKFLGITLRDLGSVGGSRDARYQGFVVPEAPSGFPPGFRLLTFYADPATLINVSYVFRKDSWEDTIGLYQRMLGRNKIRLMRKYLVDTKRAFINNVIVSLPNDTEFLDPDGHVIEDADLRKTTECTVRFPVELNSVGLIDGQHRVFAYHEGSDAHEAKIAGRRTKQQLLVTGIVFPPNTKQSQRVRFEAELFLEINDKQTRTKGDLVQAIQVIVDPLRSTAIAKAVISEMSRTGPLRGLLEAHYFGGGSIKTTSIVGYALHHVVAADREVRHSLYRRWHGPKARLEGGDGESRREYVRYCVNEINRFLSGFRMVLPKEMWTVDRSKSRALSITSLNGLIYCFQWLIACDRLGSVHDYASGFEGSPVSYEPGQFVYKSSHWRSLGNLLARGFGVVVPDLDGIEDNEGHESRS